MRMIDRATGGIPIIAGVILLIYHFIVTPVLKDRMKLAREQQSGSEAQKIGNISGFWKITPIKDKKGYYLASHYNGLYLLRKENMQWILGNN